MNITKNILAIDPGAKGGIATFHPALKSNNVQAAPIPADEQTFADLLAQIIAGKPDEWVCFMERVGGYIGDEQPGSRMFNFGDSYGFAKGCVRSLHVRLSLVRPQIWQRGIPNRVGTYSERKRALKGWAQKCFPDLKVTLATADALCILNYAAKYGISDTLGPKQQAAEEWAIAQGYEVPAYGSDEYKRMFAYWCKEVLQKKV